MNEILTNLKILIFFYGSITRHSKNLDFFFTLLNQFLHFPKMTITEQDARQQLDAFIAIPAAERDARNANEIFICMICVK